MIYSRSRNRVRLVCALLATTVIPVLAFAGIDNGKGNNGQNNGKQNGHNKICSVPEGGPGIVVLVAAIGAVLLFSSRQFSRS
jgi:hypothetical protein